MKEYERPNTVSGLLAKHKELCKLRDEHHEAIKRLTVDIEHLRACIRLFDLKSGAHLQPYAKQSRAQKGSVKRFILNTLREATEPMTSREITHLWLQDRDLDADEATVTEMRKRIGSCIRTCVNQGIAECVGQTTDHDANGPYKLWKLKRIS
jgi:hypothetical protein